MSTTEKLSASELEPTEAPATAATLVVVRDGARTWLVGSGPTPAHGWALACAVRRATGHAVTDVINTRAQAELALGNAAFAPARLWALGDVAQAMQRQCPRCLARMKERLGPRAQDLADSMIRVPTLRVDRGAASSGRLGPFRWWALERAAGSRTLVLHHPADRTVIAQGLVWMGGVPDLRDTTLTHLRQSLARLHRITQGRAVLGEAGGVGSPDDVASHLAYLDALEQAVGEALERGDLEAAVPALAGFAMKPNYGRQHPLNLQRAWRELEPAVFR